MAWPVPSQGKDEVIGPKGLVKKVEFVRIITEALYSLGYEKTGAYLEEESGIQLHSSTVNFFMQQILEGKWDESVATLHKLGIIDDSLIKLASFIILEQKFLEYLNSEKIMDALKTLRTEIAPLCVNNNRVCELSSCIVSPAHRIINGQDLAKMKPRSRLLEELQNLLPSEIMIPDKRLVYLVEQALDSQSNNCRYHNSSIKDMSLFNDHQCGRDQIPCQTLQIVQEHTQEVWFLQFSHNGRYLASSSSDCLVIIWEVNMDGRVSLKHRLSGHRKPVSYISWSPDDRQILTCGTEENVRRWDVSFGQCLHIYQKNIGLISCEWVPDGLKIFTGACDKSISMWDLEGKELQIWKGQRTVKISDLAITNDGKQIITICKENMILIYGLDSKTERFIQEDHKIMSFALSSDSKFLLVTLLNEEIHLWSIEGNLVAKYKGHKNSRYVVRSCFGGLDQAFIASGSEDSQVYVWHKDSRELVATLPGHSGSVNCVSWNPMNPHMLASASDDRTIRIWGLNEVKMECNGGHSNGVCYSNGSN